MATLIRFFAQPKYSITNAKLTGYELFIRERETRDSTWFLPENFNKFTPKKITTLLIDTLKTLPRGLNSISINLNQEQFVDLNYFELLTALQPKTPIKLQIELTEQQAIDKTARVSSEIVTMAKAYQQAGMYLCLDDVGTGANQYELVQQLAPFVFEYKFALQNIRQLVQLTELKTQIGIWRERAQQQHKLFVLEGLETFDDLALIRLFRPDVVQGYYFGKRYLLPIASDFT